MCDTKGAISIRSGPRPECDPNTLIPITHVSDDEREGERPLASGAQSHNNIPQDGHDHDAVSPSLPASGSVRQLFFPEVSKLHTDATTTEGPTQFHTSVRELSASGSVPKVSPGVSSANEPKRRDRSRSPPGSVPPAPPGLDHPEQRGSATVRSDSAKRARGERYWS